MLGKQNHWSIKDPKTHKSVCSQKQTDLRLHYGFLYWLSQLQMNNLNGFVIVVLCRNTAGHGMPNLFRTVNHNLYK